MTIHISSFFLGMIACLGLEAIAVIVAAAVTTKR